MHSLAQKEKSVEIQILIQFYLLAWDKNDYFEQQKYLVSYFNHSIITHWLTGVRSRCLIVSAIVMST